MSRFIVMTSSSAAYRGRRSVYRNVALCEVEDGVLPKMISERAKGMLRIVRHYGAHYVGKGKDCAYYRALIEAETQALALNKERAS